MKFRGIIRGLFLYFFYHLSNHTYLVDVNEQIYHSLKLKYLNMRQRMKREIHLRLKLPLTLSPLLLPLTELLVGLLESPSNRVDETGLEVSG